MGRRRVFIEASSVQKLKTHHPNLITLTSQLIRVAVKLRIKLNLVKLGMLY
jgi:hypothetical protein